MAGAPCQARTLIKSSTLLSSQWTPKLPPTFLLPCYQVRHKGQKTPKPKSAPVAKAAAKKRTTYWINDLRKMKQYSLCDSLRYIQAFEVGRDPSAAIYDIAVKVRTQKSGPVLRGRFRLPHPLVAETRVCVICPPGSEAAEDARKADAVLFGEEEVFDAVKAGKIEFDRCICHVDSVGKLNKSGIARILGPRGLMPSAKTNTIVKDVLPNVRAMVGASVYRENIGVVRMPVGQLGFTPEQMQSNIRAFMNNLKEAIALMEEKMKKTIHEVVLSSTRSPGFSLNGTFKSKTSLPMAELSVR